ncbi:MAG: helix-hairpin-helix domain-containing protein [Bacteroidales bacterium]|nr:helix-hairpin-helix domain-containing protein [Bacteroidales bacterium]
MWRDILSLSRREQLGLAGLILILLVVVVLFYMKQPIAEIKVDQELDEWAYNVQLAAEVAESNSKKDTVFRFNPNTTSVKHLQLLGFSHLAIVNLIKYREAGGQIKSPDKLRQIYGVDSVLYEKLQEYIDLNVGLDRQEVKYTGRSTGNTYKKHEIPKGPVKEFVSGGVEMKIEINSADTAMFALLKGIGPVLSRRIVAYRNKIGGYYDVLQLSEVYGLSENVLSYNLPYLVVDKSLLQPLDLSRASLRKMKNHPYLDFYMAKEIYEARKNDALVSLDQFYNSSAFSKTDTAKLSMYFVVGKEESGEN